MNGAVFDSTFNIFWKLKYARLYDSVLATPLGPRDIAVGEITWALLRGAFYAAAFVVVTVAAGYVESWWALLAVPAALLIGLAFAGCRHGGDDVHALAGRTSTSSSSSCCRCSCSRRRSTRCRRTRRQLQWVVQATPLYHAVELERQLLLGAVDASIVGHVAYLAVLGLAGIVVAARRLEKLLLK